ncbi:MAG: M1 family aminopeptidase [Nitrospinota bacterium]
MAKVNLFKNWIFVGFLILLTLGAVPAFASEPVHHQLTVELEPANSKVRVKDRVSINRIESNCEKIKFFLNAGLRLEQKENPPGYTVVNEKFVAGKPYLQKIIVQKNSQGKCPDELTFTLDYSGELLDSSNSYGDSLSVEGVFLSGSDHFYPVQMSKEARVSFEMEVLTPKPWEAVSQGKREALKSENDRKRVRWSSDLPSEEIYLIANRYQVFEDQHRHLKLYAFLLQSEEALAKRYIQTAKLYIDFYSKMLGAYPYSKFALVENPEQTGYGMPSFTLMGSRVIRFPFILHSSYPHEILHNWWGNGVFFNLEGGNWSEGLTSYLADHLLLELKGKGPQYRFQEMMKYMSYVNDTNEFPITDFSYRDSMASQAIGYGKLLMVFHMLRLELGDKTFLQGLKRYYKKFKYRYAGFGEIQKTFESVSGKKLDWFFEQWVKRKGAPKIELVDASYLANKGRYDLSIRVKQVEGSYRLKLPVAVWKEGTESPEIGYLLMDQTEKEFHLGFSEKPRAVRIDPYNEVFRKLDGREVPASIGQTFGAPLIEILFPPREKTSQGYSKFEKFIKETADNRGAKLIISSHPPSSISSIWILGENIGSALNLVSKLKNLGVGVEEEGVRLKDKIFSFVEHSFVFTLPREKNPEKTITWLIASSDKSIPGLIRKLPHYGKYGLLVFKGDEPQNVVKEIWPSNPVSLQKEFSPGNLALPEQSPLVKFHPVDNN